MLGGYGVFGTGAYAYKTFSNIPPFFKVRVWFKLYKIDSWDGKFLRIFESSILKHTTSSSDESPNKYTGNQCGKQDDEKSEVIYFEFDGASTPNLTIKIESKSESVTDELAWGFSDFAISVIRCHSTCRICTSEAQNSCESCYDHATIQAGNICLCDETYYEVTSNPCTTSICTVCKPCYAGCKKCTGGGIMECQSCIEGLYNIVKKNLIFYV